MKLDIGTEVLELILKNLVPKFGNNKLKHDRHQITSKLGIEINGSFKKVCAQVEDIWHALKFLKEDIGLYKLLLRFVENLEYSYNHWDLSRKILHELRDYICKYVDTSLDVL